MIKCSSEVEAFRNIGQKAYGVLQTNMMKDKDYSDAPDHFMGECVDLVVVCKINKTPLYQELTSLDDHSFVTWS